VKKKILGLTILVLTSGLILAQVPHRFKAGDRLNSSKLNENFTYLEQLAKSGGGNILVKDGANNVLGRLISLTMAGTNEKIVRIFSSTGYYFSVSMSTGKLALINTSFGYFSDAGCSQPLLVPSDSVGLNGEVFEYQKNAVSLGVYYINKSAVPNSTTGSYYNYDSKKAMCNGPYSVSTSGIGFYTATFNDSLITGVSSVTYTLPITLQ